MTVEAAAQASGTWVLIVGGITMLVCFFTVSAVLLVLVFIRQSRRRKGTVDAQVDHDEAADEPADEPPLPLA